VATDRTTQDHTGDQGSKPTNHVTFTLTADRGVYFCDPTPAATRQQRRHQ
jgi:IS30 family transposase